MQRHERALRPWRQKEARRPPTRAPQRLPTRRRPAGPLVVDPPALHHRHIPRETRTLATNRDIRVPAHVRQAVPVLGVRRGLPGVDEGQYTARQQSQRVWAVDVRGS